MNSQALWKTPMQIAWENPQKDWSSQTDPKKKTTSMQIQRNACSPQMMNLWILGNNNDALLVSIGFVPTIHHSVQVVGRDIRCWRHNEEDLSHEQKWLLNLFCILCFCKHIIVVNNANSCIEIPLTFQGYTFLL